MSKKKKTLNNSKSSNTISRKESKSHNDISRVRIKGEGSDEFGKRYLKFSVRGSQTDIPPFAVEKLVNDPKPLFAALTNAGWNAFIQSARYELLQKLQKMKPAGSQFKVVTRLGWNSGAYVFPDEIIGEPGKPLEKEFSGLDPALLTKYRTKGTLREWQSQIAAFCKGNSRLMFSVSLAFTGPILPLVTGPKAGGFQIQGEPETGKTTNAMVAGSVWGCHRGEGRREKGFVESWNSTSGKLEITALAHNDAVLLLDETKLAGRDDRERAQVVTSVAFGLAEMTEKERLTNSGSARWWRGYFLSTSNFSLRELGRRGRVVIDEANLGRMDDIPLPKNAHGIYEKLHGLASGDDLSDTLQQHCRKYYGTAAPKFIRKLVRQRKADEATLKKFLNEERDVYQKALARAVEAENLRKPLGRSTGRFATTFAAGSLARKYGVVPWNRRRILKAVLCCQLDQLRQPEDIEDCSAPSPRTLRIKLAQYLNDNRPEFMHLNKKRPRFGIDKIDAVPGYREKRKGERWYYLTDDRLKTIIGTGYSASALKQALATEGLLDQKKDKLVVQRKIFVGGKRNQNYAWVHAFKADLLKMQTAN
jgi:hypothetical protein